jgi:magnesium-transporting ATPase (P-type)
MLFVGALSSIRRPTERLETLTSNASIFTPGSLHQSAPNVFRISSIQNGSSFASLQGGAKRPAPLGHSTIHRLVYVYPFSSASKKMSTVVRENGKGTLRVYVKGATEQVAGLFNV